MPVARLGGKTCHGGGDEIRQTCRPFRVTGSDIGADHLLCSFVEDAGGRPCLLVVATDAFQHEAANGDRIGRIAASGFLEHRCKGFAHRPVRKQEIFKGNCVGAGIAVENAGVEPGLVAECGIETGRVDADGVGDVSNADSIVAASVEEALGRSNRLVRIETTWPATNTAMFCSHCYKIP